MATSRVRIAALSASAAAFLALMGCSAGSPDDGYSQPQSSGYERDGGSDVLMGGAPPPARPRDDGGLAGGPGYGGMAAIPNPENLPLEERRRYYGNRYDHVRYVGPAGAKASGKGGGRAAQPLRSWRDQDGKMIVAMRPIANPEDMTPAERRRVYGKRYAPRAYGAPAPRRAASRPTYAAPKPAPVAQAPRPAAPRPAAPKAGAPAVKPAVPAPAPKAVAKPAPVVPAPKPAAPVAKAPAPVVAPAAPPPAKPLSKVEQLGAAAGPLAVAGATLNVPDAVTQGQPGQVTLSLAPDLLDIIQREAAKLGLTRAARKADVSATLTGDGYEITPNGAQTQALAQGEAATFNWQVTPGDGEKSPLKAQIDGALRGAKGAPQPFSLGAVEQAVAKVVETGKSQAAKLGLPSLDAIAIPGLKPVRLGGAEVTPGQITAIILAVIALLVALALGRAAATRRGREARRRKFRTMTDYGRNEDDAPAAKAEDDHKASPAVNPMLAAAGGFAAGSAMMTFASDDDHHAPAADSHEAHDDHGHEAHAHDDHGAEAHAPDHGHEDHGHEEHGHDAHAAGEAEHAEAHGHDDHGHGAADAHAHDDHGHGTDAHHREPEHA